MVKKNRCGARFKPLQTLLDHFWTFTRLSCSAIFDPKWANFWLTQPPNVSSKVKQKAHHQVFYVWPTRKTQNQRLQWANYFWPFGSGSLLGPRHWFLSLMVKGGKIGPKGSYMVKNSCGDRFRPLRPIWTTIKHWQDRRESHLLNQYHTYNTKGVEKIKMEFKSK